MLERNLRRSLAGVALTSVLGSVVATASLAAAAPRQVFAHYMVAFATYGESVDGFKREIREAQAAGIDGFALNVGAWTDAESYYKRRVALMYDAAEQLGSGFKLFFSVDCLGESNIFEMVNTYAARPASLRWQNRLMLSAYGHNDVPSKGWAGLDWTNAILGRLRLAGIPVCFVPYFFSDPVHELPWASDAGQLLTKYTNLLDGLFLFTAAGLPDQLARCNADYTRTVHAAGKLSMASVSPHYWGHKQPSLGRRYFESNGGEGLVTQWQSILTNAPDWVELLTWNDFNESTYLVPVDDPGLSNRELAVPRRFSHRGYLELSKYFIDWYKTGTQPALNREAFYYFYRTHPIAAVARDPADVPVTSLSGVVQDTLYATVILATPASLEIFSGGTKITNAVAAGLTHVRSNFHPGPQQFTLRRGGQLVLSAQGPDILTNIDHYDCFPASGSAYGPPNVTAPVNLRVVNP